MEVKDTRMITNGKFVKIVVFVPVAHADKIREVLSKNTGKIGNYSSCSFSVKGMGRFMPIGEARPMIGEIGKLETVEEERIEVLCSREKPQEVIADVKAVHPYEEPAIDVCGVEVA